MTNPTPKYAEEYRTLAEGVSNGRHIVMVYESDWNRLLETREAALALVSGANGKSYTTEFGECYVPQDADFERLAGVVGE